MKLVEQLKLLKEIHERKNNLRTQNEDKSFSRQHEYQEHVF